MFFFIPSNAIYTVRNVGKTDNVWYYGYNEKGNNI